MPPPERKSSARPPATFLPARIGGWVLLVASFVAPWMVGSQTTLANARWWLAGSLAVAFFLTLIGRLLTRRALAIPWSVGLAALFLLGCLGWWSTQSEPHFATAFGEEHWAFLKERHPYSMVLLPRPERLTYLACLLLGFIAAIDLGRRDNFRKELTVAIGLSGMILAAYALGFAHLSGPALPWTLIEGGPERLNICFTHYSGPPACLNLAWPLLVFGRPGRSAWLSRLGVAGLFGAALPLWDSAAGKAIALGLLISGAIWLWGSKLGWLTPVRVRAAVVVGLIAVATFQWIAIHRMQSRTPDGWISAAHTLLHAPENDARLDATAKTRGDRLVTSAAPERPAGWLTALRMASDYPAIGLGPGAWATRSALYTRDSLISTFYHFRQFAHHDLLQFAAEWGSLPAGAALFLFLGGLFKSTQRNPREPFADAGITLGLLGVALHSTVDFPLQNPAIQLWTALLLGLAWSGLRANSSRAL